jgi:hypothetical protein
VAVRMRPGLGRLSLGVALWCLGTLPFLSRLFRGRTSGDLERYMLSANALLDGQRIYVDVRFDYPPYVLAWLAGPAMLAEDVGQYRLFFGVLILCLDALVKAALIWTGFRDRHRPPDALPFVMYTLATAAVGHILLQRYDVIPAAMSVAAVIALSAGWAGVAGLVAAVAVGTKVYPAVFVPVLAVAAWRRSRRDARQFAIGLVAGLLPLAAVSWSVPWWSFATVQTQRGLEAESLWASALWLSHFAGVPATWELAGYWFEVTGPVADRLVTPARIVWATATLASVALATWAAWRQRPRSGDDADTVSLSVTATLALLPVTTFVAFSLVLSPQFHLWLAPLAALALFARRWPDAGVGSSALWCIFVSTFLVPAFFPSPTFDSGLDLGRTLVLVLRNVLLLYATWSLVRTAVRLADR